MDSKKVKQLLPLIVGAVLLVLTILMPVFAKGALLDDGESGIWAVWLCILFGLVGFTAIMLYCNQLGHARYGTSFRLNGGVIAIIGGGFASWFYALLCRTNQLIGYVYEMAGKNWGKAAIKEAGWFGDRAWRIILLILALLVLGLGLYLVINSLRGKQIDLLKKFGLHKALGSVGKSAAASASAPAAGAKFCRQCGASVNPAALFCNSCGASLKDDDAQ